MELNDEIPVNTNTPYGVTSCGANDPYSDWQSIQHVANPIIIPNPSIVHNGRHMILDFYNLAPNQWNGRVHQYLQQYQFTDFEVRSIYEQLINSYNKKFCKPVSSSTVPSREGSTTADSSDPNYDPPEPSPKQPRLDMGDNQNAATPMETNTREGKAMTGNGTAATPSRLPGTGSEISNRSGVIDLRNSSVSAGSGFFSKVHKFYSYALDESIIKPNNTERYLVTGLLNIPWNRYFMYLTESEFNLLPAGTYVKKVTCRVFFRNARQAFETNASDSSLAALNQHIDVQTAVGLNHIWEGYNGKVTTTPKLIVSGFSPISDAKQFYTSLATDMYGVSEADDTFDTIIPYSLLGSPIIPEIYYAMYHREGKIKSKDSLGRETEKKFESGWHNLSSAVNFFDANDVQGKLIIDQSYTPQMGFIKKPHNCIVQPSNATLGGNIVYKTGTHSKFIGNVTDKLTDSLAIDKSNFAADTSDTAQHVNSSYYDYIEKSQFMFPYNKKDYIPKTQPWIHVGIKPAPR